MAIYSRVMWKMESQALMWERKALPKPWPAWAPFTKPAISTTFRNAGTLLERKVREMLRSWLGAEGADNWIMQICSEHLAGLWYWQRKSKRSSGMGTRLSFGSMVQKGKFSAAAWLFVRTLKNVDFLKSNKLMEIKDKDHKWNKYLIYIYTRRSKMSPLSIKYGGGGLVVRELCF